MKRSHSFVVACCLLAVPAEIWAAPLTFELSYPNGPAYWVEGGPLQSSADDLNTMVLTYTFDPLTPDSDPSSDWDVYTGAISDCTVTMGAYSFSCNNNQSYDISLGFFVLYSGGGIDYGNEIYMIGGTSFTSGGLLGISLDDAFGFTDISFSFFTELVSTTRDSYLTEAYDPIEGYKLITEPFYIWSSDTFFDIQYTYDGTIYSERAYSGAPVLKDVTTVVPVPSAVWLFGTGLLGLVGVARRRVS